MLYNYDLKWTEIEEVFVSELFLIITDTAAITQNRKTIIQ
jgi:hypothetical protein